MNRIGAALGWGFMGLIGGAIIGAAAGFIMGIVRVENVARAALAGAPTVTGDKSMVKGKPKT